MISELLASMLICSLTRLESVIESVLFKHFFAVLISDEKKAKRWPDIRSQSDARSVNQFTRPPKPNQTPLVNPLSRF